MTKWHLSIPDDVDRSVRSYLAGRGLKKGDLSAFVAQAVSREVLWLTVDDIRAQNADLSAEEVQTIVDRAVEAVRADRS